MHCARGGLSSVPLVCGRAVATRLVHACPHNSIEGGNFAFEGQQRTRISEYMLLQVRAAVVSGHPSVSDLNWGRQSALPELQNLHIIQLAWQLFLVIMIYFSVVVVCIVTRAPLMDNPNCAGRLPRLDHFCAMFTGSRLDGSRAASDCPSLCDEELDTFRSFGTRPWLQKLNYIHHWSGRGTFLAAVIHGSLWIRNHTNY